MNNAPLADAKRRLEERNAKRVELAKQRLAEFPDVTIGYIGNAYSDGTDDRSWFIFLPDDRLGGFRTSERGALLGIAYAMTVGARLTRTKGLI